MVGWTLQTAGEISELVTTAYAWRSSADSSAEYLADGAVEALIDEVLLTPKPALVDRRGSGVHRDLNLTLMLNSARSLRTAFQAIAAAAEGASIGRNLRAELASIGRAGEADMLAVTGGSNTHRGAIWVLGLLLAARAHLGGGVSVREIACVAGRIARLPDRVAAPVDTHGARVCARFGVTGARGEAQSDFPHVIDGGLPRLWMARAAGADETCASLDALMAIMSTLDDTCLLHRGGVEALRFAQDGARAVLIGGGSASSRGLSALLELDAGLTQRNASPGGCADLLAACLFLDRMTTS